LAGFSVVQQITMLLTVGATYIYTFYCLRLSCYRRNKLHNVINIQWT